MQIAKIGVGFLLFVLFSSCASKRLVYLQEDVDSLQYGQFYEENKRTYHLKKGDILDIEFTTTNEELRKIFQSQGRRNFNLSNTNSKGGGGNFYFTGFIINDTGYVEVPNLGMFEVEELSVPQAEQHIQGRLDEYFKGAEVSLRLVSFKVTFFGEIGSQGPKFFYQDQLNLVEAISMSGGVTNYADLRNILIIRKTENGRKTMKIDLTDRDLLASEDFYLAPNDMVYIRPIPSRNLRVDVADYFFYISTLTSTLSTLFLILNLKK